MNRSKGSVMIMTLLITAALIFFAALYLNFFLTEKNTAFKAECDIIAKEAANAGIDDAYYNIKKNTSWNTGFSNASLAHSGANYNMSFNQSQTAIPYSTNNANGSATVTGYGGRSVPVGMIHLVSQGKYLRSTRIEQALVSVTSSSSLFQQASLIQTSIAISGNVLIDSFNSANGTYAETVQASGGDLRTNQSTAGTVTMSGNVNVEGAIILPPNSVPSSTIVASPSMYQSSQIAPNTVTLPYFTPPTGPNLGEVRNQAAITPGVYADFHPQGDITLSAGKYVFSSFDITGQANVLLPTDGSTVYIYVTGDISISGNASVNANTKKPAKLIVYGGPNTSSVQITGGGAQSQGIYAGIYAPASDFKISGNGGIYGGIIGQTLQMSGNGGIHFDQALKTVQGVSGGAGTPAMKSRFST